jgi:hypothetical protein
VIQLFFVGQQPHPFNGYASKEIMKNFHPKSVKNSMFFLGTEFFSVLKSQE